MKSPDPIAVTDEAPAPGKAETHPRSRALPLAIASLVLGITGFWSQYLLVSGFLAVVFGHVARKLLPANVGNNTGRVVALAGLVFGYFSIFEGLNRCDQSAMVNKAKNVTALSTATALESAVNNFHTEYGKIPDVGSHITTDSPQGLELLNILLGLENLQNMRGVKFLSVREGRNRKNGLAYNSSGAPEGLFDGWGKPYIVELDSDNDEHLHFQLGTRTVALKNRRVAVYSPGKDGKPGTSDDITTW